MGLRAMKVRRRALLAGLAGAGAAVLLPEVAVAGAMKGLVTEAVPAAVFRKRLTGSGTAAARRWGVVGSELGVPYAVPDGGVGYLFGDTFGGAWPESRQDWRSTVMLRSWARPGGAMGVVFDGAVGVRGDGRAPGLVHNGYRGIGIDGVWEETAIPTDGISFPENGRHVISYVSVERRDADSPGSLGTTNYAGLAYSDDGQSFVRTNRKWWNDADNSDPRQLWTMQRDGGWVYVFSVPSGWHHGGMMLRRVRWDRMLSPEEYDGWGFNGRDWSWGRPCTPILTGRFGGPSVRRLGDGTWVMSYLNAATRCIVTRTSTGPDRPWSAEKVQVTWAQESHLYGGFVHPWSTARSNDLHLMVSTWKRDAHTGSTAYHVSQYVGTT